MGLFGLFGKKKEDVPVAPSAPSMASQTVSSQQLSQQSAELPQMPASFGSVKSDTSLPTFSEHDNAQESLSLPEIPSFEPPSFSAPTQVQRMPIPKAEEMSTNFGMPDIEPSQEVQNNVGPKFIDETSYSDIIQHIQIIKEEITQITEFSQNALAMEKKLDQEYNEYQQLISQMTRKMVDIEKSLFSGEKA
jgi:hypothetical protein